jgi:SNF2 family DNA or RNA helicase
MIYGRRYSVGLIIPENLWEHQKEVIPKAVVKPFYALFFEQGTGKTPTMVTILRNLFLKHGRPLRTLIFCPQIVIKNWGREIEEWSKCSPYVQLVTGTKKKRLEALADPDKKIFVCNYEMLRSDGIFWKWDAAKKHRKMIDRDFDIMILDESHRAKSPQSMTSKLLIRMSNTIFYRYILTGTPVLKNEMDIWSQYRILDRGRRFGDNFYAFRNKYFVDRNAGMPSHKHYPDFVMRTGAEAELNRLMYQCASRVKKDQCLDLPPLVKTIRLFDMEGDQHRAYRSMEKSFVAYVHDVRNNTMTPAVAQIVLTRALRLLQIASGFVTDENGDEIKFRSNKRKEALKDILTDAGSQKVIVWAVFKNNYEDIADVCDDLDLTYAFLTGQQNQKQKDLAVESFTKGEIQLLIANPAAGGTGVNLVEASISIWYSRNFKLEDRLQALARNHRGGSEMHDKITNIDLVADYTIEEKVLGALDKKETMAEALLR